MPSRSEDRSSVDFRDDVASAGVSTWVSAERDGFGSSFPIDVFPQLKGVIELNTDPVSLSILNAARELVIENGLGKTRMTSIAKLAGVSRPTLYSHYSNVRDVTTTLLTYEVVNVLMLVDSLPRNVDEVASHLTEYADAVRTSDLMRSIVRNDSDLLNSCVFERLKHSRRILQQYLALIIGHVQAVDEGGSVAMRSGDPRVIATVLMNIAQSFSFSYGVLHDSFDSVDTWREELNALVKGYLRA